MKRNILILLFCFVSILSFSQESNLIEFIPSSCHASEDIYRIRNRISEIYFQNDTLFLTVSISANCGYENSPFGDAILKNDTLLLTFDVEEIVEHVDTVQQADGTILISTYSSKGFEWCDCCFEFQYLIKDIPSDTIPIKLNGAPIKYHSKKYRKYSGDPENDSEDTINIIDMYGYRQGLWIIKDEEYGLISERYYKDDIISSGTDYVYYKDGNLRAKLEWLNDEQVDYVEYDESGNITTHRKTYKESN